MDTSKTNLMEKKLEIKTARRSLKDQREDDPRPCVRKPIQHASEQYWRAKLGYVQQNGGNTNAISNLSEAMPLAHQIGRKNFHVVYLQRL